MAGPTDSEKDDCPESAICLINVRSSQGYIPATCWSLARKIWVTFIIWYVQSFSRPMIWSRLLMTYSVYTFVVYCGSSIVVPSYRHMMVQYRISEETVSLILAIYIVGCKWFSWIHEIANRIDATFGRCRGTSGVLPDQWDCGDWTQSAIYYIIHALPHRLKPYLDPG